MAVCLRIQKIRQDEYSYLHTCKASLHESARCGCRYCSATCEARPEHANSDKVSFELLNTALKATYFQGYDGNETLLPREFFVLNTQDHPIIPVAKHIPGNTGSKQSFDTINGWLDTCIKTHKGLCLASHGDNGSATLPDRVIEFEPQHATSDSPNRYEKQKRAICVPEPLLGRPPAFADDSEAKHSVDSPGEYPGKRPTEDVSRCDHSQPGNWDSVHLDRFIMYDEEDWQIQSAKMADIYANSTITLAASASQGSQEGLFRIAHKAHMSQSVSSSCDIYVRKPVNHWINELPLLKRSWVFQERLISPRVLHFAEHELIWECMECRNCECGFFDLHDQVRMSGWELNVAPKSLYHPTKWRLFKENPLELWSIWAGLIFEFSQLKLSNPSDIFPAISGIAKSFGETTGWEYVAGIWRETMPLGLLWQTLRPGRRPIPWRAPTFSWASISYDKLKVISKICHVRLEHPVVFASVIEAKCSPTGEDPTGQLENGYIVLLGTLIQATIVRLKPGGVTSNEALITTLGRKREDTCRFINDFDLTQAGHAIDDGEAVFCLEVAQGEVNSKLMTWYLVLSKTSLQPWKFSGTRYNCEFERIGLFSDYVPADRANRKPFEEASPEHAVEHDAIVKVI